MRSTNPYILIETIIITACLRLYCNQKLHYFARQRIDSTNMPIKIGKKSPIRIDSENLRSIV